MTQPAENARAWRLALALLVGTAVIRLVLAALVPLFPDEAYYWVWSRHLAAGYFDHPFGIALLIRLGTMLLGATRLGVRLLVVLAGFGGALAVVATARRLAGDEAALRASLILACMPLAGAGLLLATPDAPLLLTGALCLYFLVRALRRPAHSGAGWIWWILTGIALGLSFDSKYTAVLLPLGVLVGFLLLPRLRPLFSRPEPYVASAVALVLFVPVAVWNARHGWISFTFQLGHGLGSPRGGVLAHEAALLGGQLGLASPILFVMMIIVAVQAVRRGRTLAGTPEDDIGGREARDALLAVVGLVVLGFFMLTALRKPVEANWPAPAYIATTTVLASHAGGVRWRRWLRAGLVLGAVLVALVYVQALYPVLPLPPARDPVGRAFGYVGLAGEVQTVRSTAGRAGSGVRVWIAADSYQTASELEFHLNTHPRVFSIDLLGRPNQYDLWPRFTDLAHAGDSLLLVTGCGRGTPRLVTRLAPHFRSAVGRPPVPLLRRGRIVSRRCITVLTGWDGTWPAGR